MLAGESGSQTDWTYVIALYGAVLSTGAIIGQLKIWWDRTRGRIRVSVNPRMMTYSRIEGEKGPYVLFTAANDGEKPVTLQGISIKVRGAKKELWVAHAELPRTLREGEDFTHLEDKEALLVAIASLGVKPPYKCVVRFVSNAGREYVKKIKLQPA